MITAFYAGILGLVFAVLTVAVVRMRRHHRVSLGDGGHDDLQRRIRAQANFAETVPLALILLALAEMQALPLPGVHVLGVMLLVGRLCHGRAMYTGTIGLRKMGMILTLLVICITSFWGVLQGVRALAFM